MGYYNASQGIFSFTTFYYVMAMELETTLNLPSILFVLLLFLLPCLPLLYVGAAA
jgi:hypothetical protein